MAGHYPLPWGFAASATLMSFAGNANQTEVFPFILQTQSLTVNWPVPAALFPGGQTVAGLTLPVIPPGTKFLNRWQQLTLESAYRKVGRYQWTGQLDVPNALNSNVVLTENQTLAPPPGAAADDSAGPDSPRGVADEVLGFSSPRGTTEVVNQHVERRDH